MRHHAEIHVEGAQAAMRRAPEVILRHASEGLLRAAHELASEARQLAPKAFSTLTQSIGIDRIGDLHLRVETPRRTTACRWKPGVRPDGLPCCAGLTDGSNRRPGCAARNSTARPSPSAAPSRRGIKPQAFMAPAAERMQDRAVELVRESVLRREEIAEVTA